MLGFAKEKKEKEKKGKTKAPACGYLIAESCSNIVMGTELNRPLALGGTALNKPSLLILLADGYRLQILPGKRQCHCFILPLGWVDPHVHCIEVCCC